MSSIKNSSSSLRWAIDELSKQKEDLSSKLKIAKKRDDTNSLIAEVQAQKDALSKRISSLEQGLQVSSKLVEKPVSSIESEINQVNDKLEIAKDRLNKLEQEEYLEELGKKLSSRFIDFCKDYGKKLDLYFEPGKFIISEAGFFLTRVNSIKQTTSTVFAQINSGFNHLLRPMFYGSYHEILNLCSLYLF